jgi:hypothetical protein
VKKRKSTNRNFKQTPPCAGHIKMFAMDFGCSSEKKHYDFIEDFDVGGYCTGNTYG